MAKSYDHSLEIDIKLVTKTTEFTKMVNQAICDRLNPVMNNVAAQVLAELKSSIVAWFRDTETYTSLTRGILKGEFGFPPKNAASTNRIDAILQAIANQTQIEIHPYSITGKGINGGFIVYIVKEDFSEIIKMDEAHVITKKGRDLPWLEWLLYEGNRIIIGNGGIISQSFHSELSSKGRSGIMSMYRGGFWKVPARYAGTEEDNWIIRTIERALQDIENKMNQMFMKAFYANI